MIARRALDHAAVPAALTIATIAAIGCAVAAIADHLADALWQQIANAADEAAEILENR